MEYYRIDAHNTLNDLYSAAMGFNGGDGYRDLSDSLRARIEMGLPKQENFVPEDMSLQELLGLSRPLPKVKKG